MQNTIWGRGVGRWGKILKREKKKSRNCIKTGIKGHTISFLWVITSFSQGEK